MEKAQQSPDVESGQTKAQKLQDQANEFFIDQEGEDAVTELVEGKYLEGLRDCVGKFGLGNHSLFGGTFSSVETFIIEGDSVLAFVLLDQKLSGGEFLHAVYLYERFLVNLSECSPKFKILFLRSNRGIWAHNPELLVLRDMLVRHLKENTEFVVEELDMDWSSDEFAGRIRIERPSFVLCSNGATKEMLTLMSAEHAAIFQAFLVRCVSLNQNVVCTEEMEFHGGRAWGWIIYWTAGKGSKARATEKAVTFVCDTILKPANEQLKQEIAAIEDKPNVFVHALGLVLKECGGKPEFGNWRDLAKIFLIHQDLLETLHIKARAFAMLPITSSASKQTAAFTKRVFHYVAALCYTDNVEFPSHVCDCYSNRLFEQLVRYLSLNDGTDIDNRQNTLETLGVAETTVDKLESSWAVISKIAGTTDALYPLLETRDGELDEQELQKRIGLNAEKKKEVMPFSSPLGKLILGADQLPTLDKNDDAVKSSQDSKKYFESVYKWHQVAPLRQDLALKKDKRKTKTNLTKWEKKRIQKSKNNLQKHMFRYAESLKGSHLERMDIQHVGQIKELSKKDKIKRDKELKREEQKNKRKAQINKSRKQNKGNMSKADKLKHENALRLQKQDKEDTDLRWKNISKLLRNSSFKDAIAEIQRNVDDREQKHEVKKRALLYRMDLLMKEYKADPSLILRIEIFRTIHHLYDGYSPDQSLVVEALELIGFPDTAKKVRGSKKVSPEKESIEFQLEHMQKDMSRSSGTETADPRVKMFKLEAWQVKLIDAVDANESALVVAPTSSGKTFISYYCMEKTLRESDDGVVVYISPSKALVNQVAASVIGAFNKSYSNSTTRSVYGYFTHDYCFPEEDPLKCQVLVTVPEIFEMLLLSPSNRDWVKRIKWVVFDEVHQISNVGIGAYWERLLVMSKAPFLALSATVGNFQKFHSWMEGVQKKLAEQYPDEKTQSIDEFKGQRFAVHTKRNFKVHLIQHNVRYSDLRKQFYMPPKSALLQRSCAPVSDIYNPKEGEVGTIKFVHPVHCITLEMLQERGFPADMILEPFDCFLMHKAMVSAAAKFNDESAKAATAKLDAVLFFKDEPVVTRQKSREYESLLKTLLMEWVGASKTDLVQHVLAELKVEGLPNPDDDVTRPVDDCYSPSYLGTHLLGLLSNLAMQDKMPCIVFSLDRGIVNALMSSIVTTLVASQEAYQNTEEYKKLKRGNEKKLKAQSKQQRKAESNSTTKEEKEAGQSETIDVVEELPEIELAFSFLDMQSNLVIDWRLERVLERDPNGPLLLEGLKRGIGMHHAGLPLAYRRAVEQLFRQKQLRVVISTATLALGIHMPCRSVVFAGSNLWLHPLSYRQMAGRAGRRGFDPVGNVVFFGVSDTKMKHLMSSRLPSLTTEFPVSFSTILRCLLLYAGSKTDQEKSDASKAIERLFTVPLYNHQKSLAYTEHLRHHFRLAVEYFVSNGYMNIDGKLRPPTALAAHLYFQEPSNFIFVDLVQQGVFHAIATDPELNKAGKFLKMLNVLAHLFTQTRIPSWYTDEQVTPRLGSKIVLDPLPQEFVDAIEAHNERTLSTLSLYLRAYASEVEKREPDVFLPASRLEFPGKEEDKPSETFVGTLKSLRIPITARSAFVAVSGHDDEFDSKTDFYNVRESIALNVKNIPLKHFNEHDRFNAWAVDFWRHGDHKVLVRANKIGGGNYWDYLKSFCLVIQSIRVGLEQMQDQKEIEAQQALVAAEESYQASDPLVNLMLQLSDEYRKKFTSIYA